MKKLLVACFAATAALTVVAVPAELSPKDGAVVSTHDETQKSFFRMPRPERIKKFADKDYRKSIVTHQHPLPTELSWQADGECEVKVARKADGRVVFTETTRKGKAKVDNLEIGCDYVWTVKDADGEASATFRTEDEPPRLMRVPLIHNFRDIGGRIGLGGKRVKQNMVFRSAGLNRNAKPIAMDKQGSQGGDAMGALIAAGEKIKAYRTEMKKLRKDRSGFTFPKCVFPKAWNYTPVARSLEYADAAMMAVAGQFPASDKTIAMDDRGVADFGANDEERWMALQGEIVAEADGYAVFGASADGRWALAVNGQLVRNYLKGDDKATPDSAAHKILVPVKKGANRIQTLLGARKSACAFCLRELPEENREKLIGKELDELRPLAASLLGETTKLEPGRTCITDKNRDYLLKELGVRSDIDLRNDNECYGMTGSPLGETVKWFHYSSSCYGGMQGAAARKGFANVFRVFLDERNYPIVFHCIAGADRTGSVAFILEGLLGVDENELYLDWETTAFGNSQLWFCHAKLFDELVKGFEKNYPQGKTLNEKIGLYVLSLGFTARDIEKFRSIMLEE